MTIPDTELPSNRKFGLFFAAIFTIAFVFFLIKNIPAATWVCASLAVSIGSITLIKPELLLPLNKLWMRFGLLLGMIVSPIVLGLIFFLMFFPLGFCMRFFGRDELGLQVKNAESYWKARTPNDISSDSFKNQF